MDSSPDELPLQAASAPTAEPVTKYREKLKVYAERYGTNLRNVKVWIAKGRKVDPADAPPLDDPQAMIGWWSRRMVWRVPEKILGAAREAAALGSALADGSSGVATQPPAAGDGGLPGTFTSEVGRGAVVDRLRRAEAAASDAYLKAVADPAAEAGAIELKRRAWEKIGQALRAEEIASLKAAGMQGDHIPKREAARLLQEIHASLASTWRGFLRRVRPKLAGKNAAEQDRIWDEETERTFGALPHELAL